MQGIRVGKNTNTGWEALTRFFSFMQVYSIGETCIINSPNPAGSIIEPVNYTYRSAKVTRIMTAMQYPCRVDGMGCQDYF